MVWRTLPDITNYQLIGDAVNGFQVDGNSSGLMRFKDPGGGLLTYIATPITATTHCSVGFNSPSNNAPSWFATEGNTASTTDAVYASPSGALSSTPVFLQVNCAPPAGYSLIGFYGFNSAIDINDFNAVHSDPIGTLFDASSPTAFPTSYYQQMRRQGA
jgi:hypothetical protein